ncbi:hypothetical protein PILCRDRAFT_819118 [Piloderma croceum F 1598]|uniref:F-box domain-containing protein n=1 Tax=Piloderma croceum (strain F 1598) TaxID=765440 RepID=A0A0C3FGK4_PILCF|nr:hypothetical protein PILCRDRAFT_819118 [Piloderma croceum F 1598]
MSNSSSPIILDLYQPIAEQISDAGDLASLCRVSHAFHHAAEPILYREVHVREGSVDIFCTKISQCPRLAALVRALCIICNQSGLGPICAISQALRVLTQLRSLELSGSTDSAVQSISSISRCL